jgi:hypothetical protein
MRTRFPSGGHNFPAMEFNARVSYHIKNNFLSLRTIQTLMVGGILAHGP